MLRIRRIAVLTSDDNSPGLNSCIRAVVRMAIHYGWEPWGIRDGYAGLLKGEFLPLSSRSVSNTINRGGTFLGVSRSDSFRMPHGSREALRNLNETGINALVVIGGEGSMRGAKTLDKAGLPTVGVPATIENDVCGTDMAIGADTALNTALAAIDRIKDTASLHQQAFLVEVAGRRSGYMALMTGIAGGAEMVCTPEVPFTLDDVEKQVADAYVRGKKYCLITVSEGVAPRAQEIIDYLDARKEETGFGVHLSILGHIQRGGPPMAYDRLLSTRLGAAAVDQLQQGVSGVMVGLEDGRIVGSPFADVIECVRGTEESYYELARIMSR